MSDSVIEVRNLVKFFSGKCVLNGVDLTVPRGCIYGLLGRNGTGKTTLVRILMGLDSPTRGATYLLGEPSGALSPDTLARASYVAEGHNLIPNYRLGRLVGLYRSLARHWDSALFNKLMRAFRLPTDRRINQLSAGMRAQLSLALAMATDPEVLILDDPTLGLDTVARRQFLELAIDLIQKQGRTILFSSHILADVERIADRIGILAGGKLVVDCDLEQLKHRVQKLQIIFPEAPPADLHLSEVVCTQTDGREMVITVANWNQQKQAMLDTFKPSSCTQIPMTLEEIFIECTRPAQIPASA